MGLEHEKALVLLSGGQDSTTCLAWALKTFLSVETIGFDYSQRHRIELLQRDNIRQAFQDNFSDWKQKLGQDHCLNMGFIPALGQTAMTSEQEIYYTENGLPSTFVPARNLLFFTAAAALASRRGIKHLVGGMCETDYSGYPDCRDDTLKVLQGALSLGLGERIVLHTPLMWLDKAQTWQMAFEMGGESLVTLMIEKTHTCYKGDRTQRHRWGYGCDDCPACHLRKAGWRQWQKV